MRSGVSHSGRFSFCFFRFTNLKFLLLLRTENAVKYFTSFQSHFFIALISCRILIPVKNIHRCLFSLEGMSCDRYWINNSINQNYSSNGHNDNVGCHTPNRKSCAALRKWFFHALEQNYRIFLVIWYLGMRRFVRICFER